MSEFKFKMDSQVTVLSTHTPDEVLGRVENHLNKNRYCVQAFNDDGPITTLWYGENELAARAAGDNK